MKFEGYNEQAAERVNKLMSKVITSRAFFLMLALASLILVAGANNKFTG